MKTQNFTCLLCLGLFFASSVRVAHAISGTTSISAYYTPNPNGYGNYGKLDYEVAYTWNSGFFVPNEKTISSIVYTATGYEVSAKDTAIYVASGTGSGTLTNFKDNIPSGFSTIKSRTLETSNNDSLVSGSTDSKDYQVPGP